MKRFRALVFVSALMATVLAGCAPTSAPTGSPEPSATSAHLAIFSEAAAPDDPSVELGAAVDAPGAIRFVGGTGDVEAFAVESGRDRVCLVLAGPSLETVASCYDNELFNENGIEMTEEGTSTRTFYLVPDGADGPTVAEKISENLWVTTV